MIRRGIRICIGRFYGWVDIPFFNVVADCSGMSQVGSEECGEEKDWVAKGSESTAMG